MNNVNVLDNIDLIENPAGKLVPFHANCPESNLIHIAMAHDFESSRMGDFKIMYCSKCGLGYTEIIPSEETSNLLYSGKSSSDFDAVPGGFIDRIKDFFLASLLKRISKGIKVKSVLDYSTGNGRFAIIASDVFKYAEVLATDFQAAPPPLIEAQNAVRCHQVKDSLAPVPGKYDLIVLRHVLEHTYHPVEFLQNLAGNLNPNGVMYIEVPNLNAGCAKVFKKYWTGYYVPYHVFHYTKDSLLKAVNAAGLAGVIQETEMPKMGNTVSAITGIKDNVYIKLLGIFLHPIQLGLGFFSNTGSCLCVTARRVI